MVVRMAHDATHMRIAIYDKEERFLDSVAVNIGDQPAILDAFETLLLVAMQ